MKIKLTVFLLLFPLMAEILVSCDDPDDDRPVRIVEVSNCELSSSNLSNTGPSAEIASSENIPREAYGMRVTIQRYEYSCQIREPEFYFIASARAIYPYPDYDYQYISQEEVTSIKVVSVNYFGQNYPAGSDVTDLFRVRGLAEFDYYTMDEFLDRLATDSFGYENKNVQFDIFLMETSQALSAQQFKLTLHLSDGRTLETMTEPVHFV